jgi:hypothetical protein
VRWRPEPHSPTHPVWAEKTSSSGKLGEETETLGQLAEAEGIQWPTGPDVVERRAAYVDISSTGSKPLEYGKESLLINSSIMSLQYRPVQAGWLVDLDLPGSKITE